MGDTSPCANLQTFLSVIRYDLPPQSPPANNVRLSVAGLKHPTRREVESLVERNRRIVRERGKK